MLGIKLTGHLQTLALSHGMCVVFCVQSYVTVFTAPDARGRNCVLPDRVDTFCHPVCRFPFLTRPDFIKVLLNTPFNSYSLCIYRLY